MNRSVRRRLWMLIAAVVLVVVAVPQFTLPRARTSILRALNHNLGRPVSADAVHLRLLPLPGVELDNVRLADDPAFGWESMVIADDAVATVRLRSLLRGRLVFSRLRLDQASINLVRNRAGRWNIAALLQRGGQPGGAGGSRPAASPASRFPYIEWSDSRINFKLDQVKTRFYLDQVQGSLARESGGWRLQARFEPQRTDLRLTNTGEVRLDGRWRTDGGLGFRAAPFAVAVRLENSYLAGSSALLAGHDAGVHGIVAAQMQVAGTSQAFQLQGTVEAQSLRRWDLLPPPATVAVAVAATYFPGQDRLELDGVGDPGFQHGRLHGEIRNLFAQPSADLSLELHQLAASHLLPLVMALKAHLPAGLQAAGTADGAAQWVWHDGRGQGSGEISLGGLRLDDGQDQLEWKKASVDWSRGEVQLQPSAVELRTTTDGASTLQLRASADRNGFQFQAQSADCTPAAAAALARLLGVASPWPAGLHGRARMQAALSAPWVGFRQAAWNGSLHWAQAHFQPSNGRDLDLEPLTVALGASGAQGANFTVNLAGDSAAAPPQAVEGNVQWAPGPAGARARFQLHARRLQASAVWRLLQPQPRDLMQRVWGDVSAPAWLGRWQAQGTVAVGDLDWHGIHSALSLQLAGAGLDWDAMELSLGLAQGRFSGTGRLHDGIYEVAGTVPAASALHSAVLLEPTPYHGLLSGTLAGSLRLRRPFADGSLRRVDAAGDFVARNGALATREGVAPFDRVSGEYHLHGGDAELTQLHWSAGGTLWTGSGSAHLAEDGSLVYRFDLKAGSRQRQILGP